MSALALPDIERGSPVTFAADAPVLDILDPVAETSLADTLRDPVMVLLLAIRSSLTAVIFNEPGFTRIVDERRVASPAVRVAVLKLRRVEEQPSCVQSLILPDRFLYKQSGERRGFRHVFLFHLRAVQKAGRIFFLHSRRLTECRGNVYDSGTVGQRYIRITCHVECFLVLLCSCVCGALVERLGTLCPRGRFLCNVLQDLICRFSFLRQSAQYGIKQARRPYSRCSRLLPLLSRNPRWGSQSARLDGSVHGVVVHARM